MYLCICSAALRKNRQTLSGRWSLIDKPISGNIDITRKPTYRSLLDIDTRNILLVCGINLILVSQTQKTLINLTFAVLETLGAACLKVKI